MESFKGLTIELISKADIKYKGILHEIDPANSEITLTKVKCLGSESKGINASARIFDSIRFKSSDIKDLVIDEKVEQQQVQKVEKDVGNVQHKSKVTEYSGDEEKHFESKTKGKPRSPNRNNHSVESSEVKEQLLEDNRSNNRTRSFRARYRGRGRGRAQKQHIPKEDFDFATNIDKFQKLNLEEKTEDKVEKAYDKESSFFDSLSNERTTINRHDERQMNMETFGTNKVYRPRRRGNRRGNDRFRGGESKMDEK
eukprot:NODE_8_length_47770_cov_0.334354.p13 type:complete len:255 gc:universal NODE_8_length_47770_cov_0.334354:35822-36586(+)